MKRKMFRRLMAASLATIMTVGMAGCGNGDTPASNDGSTPSESTPESVQESSQDSAVEPSAEEEVGQYTVLKDENGNVYDLGGMEIIVRDWFSNADGSRNEAKSDFEEAQHEYWDWLQETYNFTLKQMAISDWGNTPKDFVEYATTGGDENYVFIIRDDAAIASAINNGLLYDLSSLDCLDFTDEKFTSNRVHEKYGNASGIYAMSSGMPEPRTGVYFNKRLLSDAGINPEDLYDWQASGDWTWDKFRECLEKTQRDTDNDGVTDVYGFNCNNGSLTQAAVFSNGGAFFGKDESGNYTYELEDPRTLEGLEYAVDLFNNFRQVDPEGAQWDYYKQAFVNGECAFLIEDAYAMYKNSEDNKGFLVDMEDDYGFVMFPKGPQMDDYINCWTDNPVCIPACYDADKAWKLAFAWNLWTDDVPGYEGYQNAAHVYAGARDTRSVDETFEMMKTKGMIAYHGVIPNVDFGNDFLYGIAPGAVVSEKVEAIRETWKAYAEAANK